MTRSQENPHELQEQMRLLTEALKKANIKQTYQRMEIFREIIVSDEHPDAEMIYHRVRDRIPTISLDTVYRTLQLFLDLGLITTLKSPHERMRFDANREAHHHFVCMQCGMIRDFSASAFDTLAVPDIVQTFGMPRETHVEIRGLCWVCAEKHKET